MYVVMLGDRPLATADNLKDAQAHAETDARRYSGPEFRWSEHHTGLRLTSREPGRRRFAWTNHWIAAVPQIGGGRRG